MPEQLNPIEVTMLETCLNYDNIEAQLSDNYSNGGVDEFAAALPHLNRHELGGHMTNLIKRGLITEPDPESNGIVWITDAGVQAIFQHLKKNPTKN